MRPVLQIDAITGIADPVERAGEAQRLAVYAEGRLFEARRIRDEGIRDARRLGVPVRDVAGRVGVSSATVKAVTRGMP